MKKPLLSIIVFISVNLTSICQDPAEKGLQSINPDVIRAQLEFLSSDWMEGRRAGEKGEAISSDYIASMLRLYGVKPYGDQVRSRNIPGSQGNSERSFFQNFPLVKTVPGNDQTLRLVVKESGATRSIEFANNVDFSARSFSAGEVEAPVVFVGYGFRNDKLRFNDFNKMDLRGKIILKISGIPQFARKSFSQEELFSSQREIVDIAKKSGAVGIIEFSPARNAIGYPARRDFENMSPSEDNPRPAQVYASYSIPGRDSDADPVRISISAVAARQILKGTGNDIEEYIKKADANEQYTIMPVTGRTIYFKSTAQSTLVNVRNVLGIIEGNKKDEYIVLGAHYDHMGMNAGYLWNGADDNGSGTVGVMTLAKAIMETGVRPEKSVIIALWTAEEEGLLGSRYFVQNLGESIRNIKLNLNFDMISRYITDDQPDKVTMTYTSNHESFRGMTVSNNEKYKIGLNIEYQPSADPPGGSDHRSFTAAGVPVMRFKPGHREEYHTPGDETETIDWDIMEKIIRISFANTWQLANSEW